MYASDVCGARSLDFKCVDMWRFSERQMSGVRQTRLFEGVHL
jgi:hypothetical protein